MTTRHDDGTPHGLTLGARAADKMRNTMGSWSFVFIFIGVMILWAIANSAFYLFGQHGKHGFDPYPAMWDTSESVALHVL